ncbi:ketopantoate reductase family protein [Ferrimonas senticii]|uniref:ketopantoate reductase family protein n=1 Tax=Ferrimonas senticii TaxID=394566 RepID=UPI00041CF667|nr:2-dehydropantoate 2-reductase [Ferrimonas senticii]
MPARIAILGAGALGQLYAGLLAQAGLNPLLLTRPGTQAKAQCHQLQWLDGSVSNLALEHHPSDQAIGNIDALWVLTKATNVDTALLPILQWLPTAVPIVLLHNGMGPQQRLPKRYPNHHWWAGSVTDGAERLGPYGVAQRGVGQRLVGHLQPLTQQPPRSLPPGCQALGFRYSDEIAAVLWRKLTVNAILNPICTRERICNGELIHFADEVNALATELAALAKTLGFADRPAQISQRVLEVANRTAGNRCSTLQDVEAGRPTEMAAILGFVLETAKRQRLSLPLFETLYQPYR